MSFDLSAVPTCELVDEFKKREGVWATSVEPYEKYSIKPIGDKRQSGHSFPSIHASLTLSIALTVIKTGPNMGLLLFALAFTITITRLLTGEHYLTDIIASILIALGIYFIS